MKENDNSPTTSQNPEIAIRLRRLTSAVFVLLLLALAHTLFWPFAWIIAAYGNDPILSQGVLMSAVPCALITAYIAARLVLPVTYNKEGIANR